MSAFNGQRGPNVSEYIANLNAIPSAQDMASQNQDNFHLDDDLAMFTNTQFFDFDLGQDADLQPTSFAFDGQSRTAPVAPADGIKGIDFTHGDFAFPDFASFQPADAFAPDGMAAIQANHTAYASSSTGGSPPSGLISPQSGDKRKAESISENQYAGGFEDASRMAAEEDKRRRNTAASARFRVKKKQREAALEKSAKEMADKVTAFENRISQLETENKWLKNLIMEKNGDKDDIAALWKKYNEDERKGSTRKDGVGTQKI